MFGGLRSAGIPVIVLKGAFLAEAVYGDIALRPMCDADLMVTRAVMPRAWAALLDMGGVGMEQSHQAAPAPGAQSPEIESWCRKESHLPAVVIRHLTLEVHWTIVSPTGPVRVDTAGPWDRARPASIAGVDVLALSPEDLLVHLCLHVCYQHRLEAGLLSYYDIAETIHRFHSEIDWMQVLDRAREWGATRQVGLILYLAGRMSGAAVPDDVLGQLIPGGLDQCILEMASESVTAQMSVPGHVSRYVRGLWSARSLGDRAKLAWERVFLSREEMTEKYPQSRNAKHLCFYYARRLRDVLDAHGAAVPRDAESRHHTESVEDGCCD